MMSFKKWISFALIVMSFLLSISAISQGKIVSRKNFFADTSIIEMKLTTDLRKLSSEKAKPSNQEATIEWLSQDTTKQVVEPILIRPRGNFRKANCRFASVMIDFKTDKESTSRLKNLKQMKMVGPCGNNKEANQLLLREYLAYKIYNELTDLSFKVRLTKVVFTDAKNKVKPFENYVFFIEDIDDLAQRNDFIEKKGPGVLTEQTNRSHTTLVSVFEYMIGNTDWAVPNKHNLKLIVPEKDTFSLPYVVPYDFDFSGLVNAPYAFPNEIFSIERVTDRLYRGFPRRMDEIRAVATHFNSKEAPILKIVQDFGLLNEGHKKEMIVFLQSFFALLKNEDQMKQVFITDARSQ